MRGIVIFFFVLQAIAPRGSIEGFVVRAGTNPLLALTNARLELTGGQQLPVSRTDGTGRFVFANLAPGRYQISVTKDGYIRQQYGQRRRGPGGWISVAAGQQVKDITFLMDPAPTIAGLVLDAEGSPIPNARVQALRSTYDLLGTRGFSAIASTRTDDRGEYRLYWLDPGEYFVSALAPPLEDQAQPGFPMAYAQTYFPGFPNTDNAKPIRLEVGREARGIDFRLTRQPIPAVTGDTVSALTNQPVASRIRLSFSTDGSGAFQYEAQSNNQGKFSIPGVGPGSYVVSAASIAGERWTAFGRLQVRNFDPRLTLELGAGVVLSGRAFSSTNTAMELRGAGVQIIPVDAAFSAATAPLRGDGIFSLPAVQPGIYVLSVAGLDEDWYLSAARFGAADPLEKPLVVRYSRDETPPLEILLAVDGGRMGGVVLNKESQPFSGAQVTLVPTDGFTHRLERYKVATTDEDGRFTIRGISPGPYQIFAWDRVEPRAWLNSNYIRQYEDLGTAVTVVSGENSAVSIRLIESEP